MLNALRRYEDRKHEEGLEAGFTLIELLIVIVVLGILAAVTVFALTGVTSTSAVAACNSDASSVNTAVQAYAAQNGGSFPANVAALTASANGGPYLQNPPAGGTHYSITTTGGIVTVTAPTTGGTATQWAQGGSACAGAK
jgi:prepilin-type N-terminal cleavage/methylation domain-containing protein